MPLINQPTLNADLSGLTGNPYLDYDFDWVQFDLIVENGDVVLYSAHCNNRPSFTFASSELDPNIVIPFVSSDSGDRCMIAGDFNGTTYPPGDVLGIKQTGLITGFPINSADFTFIWTHNWVDNAVISKQALNLHSGTNMELGINPAGAYPSSIGGGAREAALAKGLILQPGGYWESSSLMPVRLTEGYRNGCSFKIHSDTIASDVSFSLSGYAEIRRIIEP